MKHPIDEETPKNDIPPEVIQASIAYKANRDQILAIKDTSWFRFIMEWFAREKALAEKQLLTASLNTDDDKKHLLTVRGEYTISDKFLTYIKNLELSKERD